MSRRVHCEDESKNYQSAVIITGSVTCIATNHFLYMINSWVYAFIVKSPGAGPIDEATLSQTPFVDALRLVDWFLTVPLLLIELVMASRVRWHDSRSDCCGTLGRYHVSVLLHVLLADC